MRFKVGSMVEVFTKNKVPLGSWRCAEIMGDDGDSYRVRFYRGRDIPKEKSEKVKAEDVRPRPPLVTESTTCAVGDIVEVLDDGYWKVSMIDEVLEEDCYQIHVVGSIDEFRVKKSNVRVRQEWKEGKWSLIEKDNSDCEDMITRMRKRTQIQKQQCDRIWHRVPDSDSITKVLKRPSPDVPSGGKDCSRHTSKRRAVSKKGDVDGIPVDGYSLTGKEYDRTSTSNKINVRSHGVAKCPDKVAAPANSVSIISSVASCSVIGASHDRVLSCFSAGCRQNMDSLCSDAESKNLVGYEEQVPVSQSTWYEGLKTHDLDLRSYRCILETLYASGPLSWEEEALLTNFRMKFYVSNDQHLMELRRLKCIGGLGLSCY